jgi:T-complex protein 1 subunit eta
VINQRIANMYKQFVWEPELVRINVISAATEAACTILSVDQTIRNPNSEQQQTEAERRLAGNYPRPPRPQMGRGIRGRGGK